MSCYHDVDAVMKELGRLFPASTPIILTSAATGCCVDGIWLRGTSVQAQDGDSNGNGAEETRGATTKPEIAHNTKFHVRTYVPMRARPHPHPPNHPTTHTRARTVGVGEMQSDQKMGMYIALQGFHDPDGVFSPFIVE